MTNEAEPPLETGRETPFQLGEWGVIPARNLLVSGETEILLQPKVMRLLTELAAFPGDTLSRSHLVESVWDGLIVSDAAIDRAVCNLRKALGETASAPKFVETVRKKGIRLKVAPADLAVEETARPRNASFAPSPRGGHLLPAWIRDRWSRIAALVLVALSLSVYGGWAGAGAGEGSQLNTSGSPDRAAPLVRAPVEAPLGALIHPMSLSEGDCAGLRERPQTTDI